MTALDRIAADLRVLAEDIENTEYRNGETGAAEAHRLRIAARQVDAQAEMIAGKLMEP